MDGRDHEPKIPNNYFNNCIGISNTKRMDIYYNGKIIKKEYMESLNCDVFVKMKNKNVLQVFIETSEFLLKGI